MGINTLDSKAASSHGVASTSHRTGYVLSHPIPKYAGIFDNSLPIDDVTTLAFSYQICSTLFRGSGPCAEAAYSLLDSSFLRTPVWLKPSWFNFIHVHSLHELRTLSRWRSQESRPPQSQFFETRLAQDLNIATLTRTC